MFLTLKRKKIKTNQQRFQVVKDCAVGELYDKLSPDQVNLILAKERQRDYAKGETIVSPGDMPAKLYVLKKGRVKISQLSREGKKFILEIIWPGGVFSNAVFLFGKDGEFNDYMEAIKKSTICEINKADLEKLIMEIPQLGINLINIIGQKLNEADSRLRDIALLDIKSRLKHELLHLARSMGFDKGDHYVIREKVTHEQLGEMLGASRETITKTIKQLKKENFLSTDYLNRLIIKQK